jgi:hypothetical protein
VPKPPAARRLSPQSRSAAQTPSLKYLVQIESGKKATDELVSLTQQVALRIYGFLPIWFTNMNTQAERLQSAIHGSRHAR